MAEIHAQQGTLFHYERPKSMNVDLKRSINVIISQRCELEQQLDTAVASLLEPAKATNQGVLVTRLGPRSFTVSLSEEVPYGMTLENASW